MQNETIELNTVATFWMRFKGVLARLGLRVFAKFARVATFAACCGLVFEAVSLSWGIAKRTAAEKYDAVVSEAVAMEAHRFGYFKGEVFIETQPTTIRKIVQEECVPLGLSESFILGLIEHESAIDDSIVSKAGAIGLMQVMPATARLYGFKPAQMYQPRLNIRAGCRNMIECTERFDWDMVKALYCYNAGPKNVSNPPAESIGHAQSVIKQIALPTTKLRYKFDQEIKSNA